MYAGRGGRGESWRRVVHGLRGKLHEAARAKFSTLHLPYSASEAEIIFSARIAGPTIRTRRRALPVAILSSEYKQKNIASSSGSADIVERSSKAYHGRRRCWKTCEYLGRTWGSPGIWFHLCRIYSLRTCNIDCKERVLPRQQRRRLLR